MVDGADQQPAAGAGRAAGSSGGFGPEGAWRGYHDVIDHFAARSPRALAVEDAGGAWSYTQLRAASLRAAALLAEYGLAEAAQPAPSWSERPTAPRPLAVWAPRGRELIALCVGAWRLGLPVVALSRDMADKALELERNRQAVKSLRPLALVSDERGGELLSSDKGAKLVSWAELLEILRREEAQSLLKAGVEVALRSPVSPQSALVYVYTGGTTKASKCVTVTHAMALWEAENYSTALRHKAGPGDKMLQYSTLYWGAAVFGQISIGFAVGACVCIGGCPAGCTGAGDALRQLVADVEAFQITVLGVVPSQLRGAWPDGPAAAPKSIHTVVVWADKCPPELSRRWKTTRIQVVDLLIASEYWLALHSDCSSWSDGAVEKHVYRALPALEARFLVESVGPTPGLRDARPGEVGEMYLAGPTTSPGYVCPDGRVSLDFHDAARVIDGRMYLRTRDQLLLLEGGGLVYSGRADSMMKHGGQWVDADALQDAVVAVPGAAQAAVLPSAHGIDAFVVLHSAGRRGGEDHGEGAGTEPRSAPGGGPAPFRVLAAVRRALPASTPGGCRIHLRMDLPLNAATAKVDRKALQAELEAMGEARRRHEERQAELEGRAVSCYGLWARLGAGLVCGPALSAAALQASWELGLRLAGNTPAPALAKSPLEASLAAAGLGAACAARLLAAPELHLAAAFLQERWNGHPWASAFNNAIRRGGLPDAWASWLPLLPAAMLPTPWLARMVLLASGYLARARLGDAPLAAGLVAAAAVSALPAGLLPAVVVGLAAVVLRPASATELAAYLAAAPGLFWQVLPKFLADELGPAVDRRLGGAALRQPVWQQTINWDADSAVVDEGNRWDQVVLTSCKGGRPWDSIGVRVALSEALSAEDSPVAGFLRRAADSSRAATEGMAVDASGQGDCDAGPASGLAALVERICGGRGADALHGLDSMQAIQLTEAIRREFQKPLGVSDVLRCTEFSQLAEAVDSCTSGPETVAPQRPRCEAEPWRIWLCGMGPRTCSVDWMVSRADRGRHLDVTALQRALDRLVARHAVLRCRNASEVPAFDATYLAASMWQLWCARRCFWTRSWLGRLASASIFRAWPRTTVLNPADPSAKVSLLRPTVAEVLCEGYEGSDDNRAFWAGGALCARGTAGHLFHVCVIPVFKDPPGVAAESDAVEAALAMPPSEVRWYVYAVLDHGYCDGPAGAPLFADFLRLYAEEAGEPAPEAAAANANHRATQALEVLQQRLKQSLKPLPEAHHPNHDIFHDGLVGFGWRRGYQRHIRMDVDLMRLMRVAAREVLGCSVDVAWLTVIAGAFLRLFPHLRRLDLYLVVTCRDGPGEEAMIGYFSSRKIVQLEVGDPRRSTLLGLADNIATVRRERSWRRPRPFEKADAIEVNIVSQAADGLPLGFQEVRCSKSAPRDWSRGATSNMNLRLDQTERDGWDFRLQSHDASWGWKWSSYYAQAMGSTIVDMALRPTDGIVPSAE